MCIDGDCSSCPIYKCRINKSIRARIWKIKDFGFQLYKNITKQICVHSKHKDCEKKMCN